jgi:diguanylate cyclase (GGDEF)-like protein
MTRVPPAPTDTQHVLLDEAWLRIVDLPREALARVREWESQPEAHLPGDELFALVIRGQALLRSGEPAQAVELAERTESLLSEACRRQTVGALLAARAGTLAAAVCIVRRDFAGAMDRVDAALGEAGRLPAIDRFYLRYLRAMAHVGQGRQDLAFTDLLAEYDSIAAQHPGLLAVLQLNLGAVLVHVGDWQGAERTLHEAIPRLLAADRRDAVLVARMNLAYTLVQCERLDEARAEMAAALTTDRAFMLRWHPGDLLATVGESLIATGFDAEAGSYLATLREQAERAGYRVGLGAADWCEGLRARRADDIDGALAHWRRALMRLRRTPQVPHLWKTMRAVAEAYAACRQWRRAYRWQRRFHTAFRRWELQFASARLTYARERQELLRAREQALRDPATGLLNRRGLDEQLGAAIARAARDERALQVCMIDIDNLKPINDRLGHAAGDAAIAAVADELRVTLGAEAQIYRWGGDEFIAVLPGMTRDETRDRLTDLLARLRRWRPPGVDERRHVLSVSAGIASYPQDGMTATGLLDAADTALYRAKKAGGDQTALTA